MNQKQVVLKINPDKKFEPKEVQRVMRAIVHEQLQDKVYDHIYAPNWTKFLTRTIHEKLKELGFERYKFVVQVAIGEDRAQGMKAVAGCIWDEERDGNATVLFTSETLFCIVAVFAVFCYRYE